jgi:MoaA/NifB/PqqE/SkfB family radical SAM enzyme
MTMPLTQEETLRQYQNSPQDYSAKNYIMRGAADQKELDVYHLILAPTHACNLRCRHCYLPDHSSALLSFDSICRLIEQWEKIVIRERGPLGGYFHLKGGEPLVLPYLVDVLDHLAAKRSLRFMMTTNGTLLTESLRRALSQLNEALSGQVLIIVSLDGSNEITHSQLRGQGQFEISLEFAQTLIGDGLNVHFNYVVHSGNLHDVPSFVELAEQVGAEQINFLPMVPKGFGAALGDCGRPDPQVLHDILETLFLEGDSRRRRLLAGNYADILAVEKRGVQTSNECVAGYKGLFYITPEGEVYTCPNLVHSALSLGNFLNMSLVEIHDCRVPELYSSRFQASELDERYLCRGERTSWTGSPSRRKLHPIPRLPVLAEAGHEGSGYPLRTQELQHILLAEGQATKHANKGISYCFSRNF